MERNSKKMKRKATKKNGLMDLKLVMVGDASVGKTCMVVRYTERRYHDVLSTIGASFVLKTWNLKDIAIWDTAGEERFAGMTTFYYRNASAAILAFDMFDRTSFYNLQQRYIPVLNNVSTAKIKVIVATKCDLLNTKLRQVSREEGIALAKATNPNIVATSSDKIPYFETSAKTGENVDELFEYIFKFCFTPTNDVRMVDFAHDSVSLTSPLQTSYHARCFC